MFALCKHVCIYTYIYTYIIILTFSHDLQRPNYQTIVNLAFDSLDESLIFQRVLGHMHEQLSKCETSDRKGVDEQRARDETVTLEQLQHPLAVIQSPARPKELFDLWETNKQKKFPFSFTRLNGRTFGTCHVTLAVPLLL